MFLLGDPFLVGGGRLSVALLAFLGGSFTPFGVAMGRLRSLFVVCLCLFALLVAFPAAVSADDCVGRFAVGGYPAQERVPSGFVAVPTPGGIFPWERGGYAHGQRVGAANMIATVDRYAERCPNGPIYLEGHSYGAAVVHTAVETIDSRPYAPRVHVYLTGNPRHPGGIEDSWRGLNILGFGFRGPAVTPSNVASFVDVCNPRDAICSMPPWWNVVGTVDHWVGYLTGAHRY